MQNLCDSEDQSSRKKSADTTSLLFLKAENKKVIENKISRLGKIDLFSFLFLQERKQWILENIK